ncbi:MAG TPA: serine/threonine-protein kinase [Polyangiaceae bacterium]|nr:serine/threonine-protein kinase [Polyangiaceae bacterium]
MTEFREFQDGEVIAGTRYRVLGLIGVGGMGSVYEVEHTELGKRFVLKALLRELSRRDDLVQRLRNEWRALARLQHANIVNVTDAGTSGGGVPFYVMERLEGETLAALLRQKRRLPVLEAVHIATSVLEALSAAHDIGIIHRDVKPANVFVVNGGGVKLLDFGIAKIADASSVVTARGLAVGTPRYMSPEQARGERVDGRSDIYASALMLYEMIAGVGPFDDVHEANDLLLAHLAREAPRLSSWLSGVSPELDRIMTQMLAKDCRQRPAHAREAAEQLRDFARRQAAAPATDAPTARAGYGAETVAARPQSERPPSPVHDALTRPEGAARARLVAQGTSTEDALTRPIATSFPTTQVTLSATTSEPFSVSSVPNTTYVSAPSFDGTTTLRMNTVPRSSSASATLIGPALQGAPAVERPERTEMLEEPPPPMPSEPGDTRTLLPVVDRPRPASITPPPVVDTGRGESSARPRARRIGLWAGLAAAVLGVAIVGTLAFRWNAHSRGGAPGGEVTAAAAPAPPTPSVAILAAPAPGDVRQEAALPAASEAAPIPIATANGATTPAPAEAAVATAAASASAGNPTHISQIRQVKVPSLAVRSPGAAAASGPNTRNISARPSHPTLPGSGL